MQIRQWRTAALACVMLAGLTLLTSGCIRSRMRITSEPAQADVFINDVHYGRTPVEVPFSWYWYYKVEARKDGYEPVEEIERLRAPIWMWIPFDLICEAMPFPIYDTKKLHYNLYKQDRPL